MSDKITLKEWSAYLPHKLTIHNEHLYPDHVSTLDGIWGDSAIHSEDKNGYFKEKLGSIKPILRPLSDLTREITHDGETFVPVEWFEIGDDENECPEYTSGNITLIEDLCKVAEHNNTHDLQFMPYGVIQKLVEWHFDVFGLLGRGLAEPLEEVKTK